MCKSYSYIIDKSHLNSYDFVAHHCEVQPQMFESFNPFRLVSRSNRILDEIEENDVVGGFAEASHNVNSAAVHVGSIAEKITEAWNRFSDVVHPMMSSISLVIPAMAAKIGIYIYRFITSCDWFNRILTMIEIFIDFFLDHQIVTKLFQDAMESLNPCQVEKDASEVIGQSLDQATGAMGFLTSLVSIGGAIVTGCIPSPADKANAFTKFSSKMFEISKIGNGMRNLEYMFKKSVDLMQHIIGYFFELKHPDITALETLDQACEGIGVWAARVHELSLPDLNAQFSYDEELRKEVFDMVDKGNDYYNIVSKLKLPNSSPQAMFMCAYNSIVKTAKEVLRIPINKPFRIDPFCIWTYGQPGTLKSTIMNKVIEACATDEGIAKFNRIFFRQTFEQYFSGYSGQYCLVIDDFGQSRDQTKCNEYVELINLKSNAAMQLQMAAVEEKGRPFTSQMIYITSNSLYPDPIAIECKEALWRRRNLLVKIRSTLPTGEQLGVGDYSHLRFDIMHPWREGQVLKRIKHFDEFLMYVRLRNRAYLALQRELLADNMKFCANLKPITFSPEYCEAILNNKKALDELVKNYNMEEIDLEADQELEERMLLPLLKHRVVLDEPSLEGVSDLYREDQFAERLKVAAKVDSQSYEYLNSEHCYRESAMHNLPLSDMMVLCSKVRHEGYIPERTFHDVRLVHFIYTVTGIYISSEEGRAAMIRKPSVTFRANVIGDSAIPKWSTKTTMDFVANRLFGGGMVSWLAYDLEGLLCHPPDAIEETLQHILARRFFALNVYPHAVGSLLEEAILLFLNENYGNPFDLSFPALMAKVEPRNDIWIGNEHYYRSSFEGCKLYVEFDRLTLPYLFQIPGYGMVDRVFDVLKRDKLAKLRCIQGTKEMAMHLVDTRTDLFAQCAYKIKEALEVSEHIELYENYMIFNVSGTYLECEQQVIDIYEDEDMPELEKPAAAVDWRDTWEVEPQGWSSLAMGASVSGVATYAAIRTLHDYRQLKVKRTILENRGSNFIDPRVFQKDLAAWKIVEFKRAEYSHFGIMTDRNTVIHMTGEDDHAIIVEEEFDEVAQGDSVRVNNLPWYASRYGYTARLKADVKVRATQRIGKRYKYDLFRCNCEHFATLVYYGVPFSSQAYYGSKFGAVSGPINKWARKYPDKYTVSPQMMEAPETSTRQRKVAGHIGVQVLSTYFDHNEPMEAFSDASSETFEEEHTGGVKVWFQTCLNNVDSQKDYWEHAFIRLREYLMGKFQYSRMVAETEIVRLLEYGYAKRMKGEKDETTLDNMTTLTFYLSEVGIKEFDPTVYEFWKRHFLPLPEVPHKPTWATWFQRKRQEIKDMIGSFYSKHPHLTKVFTALAICGVVATAYTMYNWFTGAAAVATEVTVVDVEEDRVAARFEEQNAYHVDGRRAAPKTVMRVVQPMKGQSKGYHDQGRQMISRTAARKVEVKSQDFDQQVTSLTSGCIRRNTFRIVAHMGGGHQNSQNAVGVVGQLILCNYHFFAKLKEEQLFSLFDWSGNEYIQAYQGSRCRRLRETDVAMYECSASLPCVKDIRSKFVKEDTLQYFDATEAVYYGVDDLNRELQYGGFAKALDYLQEELHMENEDADSNKIKTYIRKGWSMQANTQKGYCGSPLLACNIPREGRIIGIHTASWQRSMSAISCLVTYEDIMELTNCYREQVKDGFHDTPEYKELYLKSEIVDSQSCVGNFTEEGAFKVRIGQPRGTRFKASMFQGTFPHEPVTEPAVLWGNDERVDPEFRTNDLLGRQVSKYGSVEIPFPNMDLHIACDDVQQRLNEFTVPFKPRALTEEEAINGIEGVPHFDRMDMQTSPGYPYVQRRPAEASGKEWLFGTDEKGKKFITDCELRQRLDNRLGELKEGKLGFSIWTNCLKDERRKTEKIKTANTRAFCAAPVDFIIASRMFFLAFCAAFIANRNSFFGSIGINPESAEWTFLYNRHRVKGKYGFDIDFKNFDGSAKAIVIALATDLINNYYNDGPENALKRRVLIQEMIHTRSWLRTDRHGNVWFTPMVQKHCGVPSGTNITCIIDTLVQAIYMRVVYRIIMRKSNRRDLMSMKVFNDRVADTGFGDDGFVTADLEILKYFNRVSVIQTLADFGITCTDAKKTGNISKYDSLNSLVFLKRHFAPHPQFPDRMLAPIDVNSIYELINWVSKTNDPEEQLRMNIDDALRFAYHYGDKFYQTLRDEIAQCANAVNMHLVMPCWTEWDDAYINEWLGERIYSNHIY